MVTVALLELEGWARSGRRAAREMRGLPWRDCTPKQNLGVRERYASFLDQMR
jgi:hypothetical protein